MNELNAGMVARTAEGLAERLLAVRTGFSVRRVPVDASPDWGVRDGALQHLSGGFFSVNAVEIGGRGRLYLYQPQSAVTGVLTARIDGARAYLIQARAEPGCLDEAQYGPTVQSTAGNYLRFHGGIATPHIDAFLKHAPGVTVLDDTSQLDLGERYLFKTKRSILLETETPGDPGDAFVWAHPEAILAALGRSAFLNTDLRSILAIAPWSAEEGSGEIVPRSAGVRQSLTAPLRADVLGQVLAFVRAASQIRYRPVPLDALTGWRADADGWTETVPEQGFAIRFFETEARLREVARWVQPLIESDGEGEALLACRMRGGRIEVLVRPARETGLAGGAGLLPTFLRYPGAPGETPDWLRHPSVRVWSETRESDEGGRFFRDVSRHALLRVDDAPVPEDLDGLWLTVAELKACLSTSNLCTIQLRGVASQLASAGDD